VIEALFDKVAFDRDITRGYFPLRLCSEPRICPACISISFVIANVADRLSWVYLAKAVKRHYPPTIISLFPVQRSFPSLLLYCVPAIGKP
jgi:hypothetical protein